MTPKQQIQFRALLGQLMIIVGRGSDPSELITHTEKIEKWIDEQSDTAVTAAVMPFAQIDLSSEKGSAIIKPMGFPSKREEGE